MKNIPIYALAQSTQNPNMILAGTAKGVYASYDSANSWEKISDETKVPGMVFVESLAIDPRNSDIIYAGTWYRPYKTPLFAVPAQIISGLLGEIATVKICG